MGKNGSGSVGKAGRDGYQAPPMDLYRRQIAKQDSKKEKKHLKEVKHQVEAKSWTLKAFKEIILILLAIMTVLMGVYAILYLSMEKKMLPEEL